MDDENLRKDTGDECETNDDEQNNDEEDGAGEKGDDEEDETNVVEGRKRKRGTRKH